MIKFNGLILIDCWGQPTWHEKSPKSKAFYKNIVSFLNEQSIVLDNLIFATYGGITDQSLFEINANNIHEDVFDWNQFKNKNLDHGNWLMGGAAWESCIHYRPFGLVSFIATQPKCELISHPDLIDTRFTLDEKMSEQHFENDKVIKWIDQEFGFYKVSKQGFGAG